METKELRERLAKSAQGGRDRYIPWWEGNFEDFAYKYEVFSAEDIETIEACVESCGGEELEEVAGGGYPLFHLLVWHNFYHAVEKILEEGKTRADLPDSGGRGITPLMMACCVGNAAMAELLIGHGADASACDARGNNGYHYLANARMDGLSMRVKWWENTIGQRASIARLLTADINGRNSEGLTPMELLLEKSNPDFFYPLPGIFLEKGAETDSVDESGNTLLLRALSNNHITAAMRLMKCGDLINRENNEGISPLKLAKERHNEALCIALRDHGATLPDDGTSRIDLGNLSRLAGNTFAECSPGRMDKLELALHLAEKLVRQVDTDDDDEMRYIADIIYNAVRENGDNRLLDICSAAGIDFTAPIHTGGSVTCLRDTCLTGNCGAKAIQKLMELGVDMETAVVGGKTPANVVASEKERNMIFGGRDEYFEKAAVFFSRESMEQSDNGGTTAVHQAARQNHAEMLRVMAEKGVNVNLTEDEPAEAGDTPLHTACIWGSLEAARVLLEAGADDSLRNINGELPAHMVVMKKKFGGDLPSKKRAELLKELKTLDGARNDGKTPLMLLQYLDISTGRELLPLFLDRGVDVNSKDSQGNTALIHCTMNDCFKDIVKELVRAGADVNQANGEGNTALHYALRYGSQDTARFLIKKGADYNHANNQGVTPVQLAVEKGYDTVLELMTDI